MSISDLFEKAIVLSVTLSRPGNRKKVSSGLVEVEADRSLVHVSKDLLDSAEYKAIQKKHSEIRRYIFSVTLPSSILGAGRYLCPIPSVETVDKRLAEFDAEVGFQGSLVEEACTAYPVRVEEAQKRLGVLYNPADYPPVERYRAGFGMVWMYQTWGVPGQLENISKAIFDRESERAKERVKEAELEVTQILYEQLRQLCDRMVERLTPGEDGKQKIFRNSLITNMEEFLAGFSVRNLAENQQLESVVEEARRILKGVEPDQLRDSTPIREYVAQKMTAVKAALDTMVVAKPSRMIVLSDDDAA